MGSPVALEAVLRTEELDRRPPRPPDYENENRALVSLAQALADSPRTILQTLTDTLLEVFQVDSAGISLLREGEKRFYWPAISGVWKAHRGGGTPRDFGPCGDVLDHDAPLLFTHFERRYAYFLPLTPPVEECLVVPFHVKGKAVGTIWVIAHDQRRKFDAEDRRQLVSMGKFAASSHQVVAFHDKSVAMNEALMLGSVRQHELTEAADAANDDLAASDTAKDHFLAVLSHELRSPLNVIRLWSQILQAPGCSADNLRKGLDVIDRSTKAQTQLVDDLLDVHRITSGKLRLELAEVELAEIIRAAVDSMALAAREKQIQIERDSAPAPVLISGDPARLQQVLGNLLGNAIKFTPNGGAIRVALHRTNKRAEIRVSDTGQGISVARLGHIFERFRQADPLTSRSQGGLGLGLAIAKQLVELHGGSLTADSPGEGAGATFTVSLPLAQRNTTASRAPVLAAEENPSSLGGVLVLVVEDDPDAREAVRLVLEYAGAETMVVGSTDEALDAFGRRQPDLILSDIGLPGRDGYSLVRAIRALPSGRGGRVPAIALTAYAASEDRERALSAGFQTHLAKPVESARLIAAVAALVPQTPPETTGGSRRSRRSGQ